MDSRFSVGGGGKNKVSHRKQMQFTRITTTQNVEMTQKKLPNM